MAPPSSHPPSDIEIAQSVTPAPLGEVAAQLGLEQAHLSPRGEHVAKLADTVPVRERTGKLILVTATTPTRKGEGKTVTAIGLGQGLSKLGARACLCLREPSLGPTFGIKGGAAGGGRSQLLPMEEINLHFTGDLHAITAAHNLLAALADNHAHFELEPPLSQSGITWPRALDVCDRQLRNVQLGLGKPADGFAHASRFVITAASEVMATAALARDLDDLQRRLARIVVGHGPAGEPVRAADVGAVGAMSVLLRDALRPNLVQTLEHTPALVHLGPFANIAHGCSSVAATRAALSLADYTLTEAGFGADLGAEKFLHIKCRQAGLEPAAAVLVTTCAGLRRHGGVGQKHVSEPNLDALERGLDNLSAHRRILSTLGLPCLVALNRTPSDTEAEIAAIRARCDRDEVDFALSDAYAKGGDGAVDLAQRMRALADGTGARPRFLYDEQAPLCEKIETVAGQIYGAAGVDYAPEAAEQLDRLEADGYGALGVCMAKTQYSLSDDPRAIGAPTGFRLRVSAARVSAGAGFVVAETGEVNMLPGMPREPNAHRIGVDARGRTYGLF